jgi:hypothetical protein
LCQIAVIFISYKEISILSFALEQSILDILLLFAAQLLIPGAAAVFKLLANRWCGWEIFGERSMQFSKRVPDSAANSKMRLDSSILTYNSLAAKFAIGLCNSKEVCC